jgi:hypothetical protein
MRKPGNQKRWLATKKMAGVAGLEPVTSAVTGQRSNQLSYTPAQNGGGKVLNGFLLVNREFSFAAEKKRFGQQTPRRWGWRTPLKKRAVTRIKIRCKIATHVLFVNTNVGSGSLLNRRTDVRFASFSMNEIRLKFPST